MAATAILIPVHKRANANALFFICFSLIGVAYNCDGKEPLTDADAFWSIIQCQLSYDKDPKAVSPFSTQSGHEPYHRWGHPKKPFKIGFNLLG